MNIIFSIQYLWSFILFHLLLCLLLLYLNDMTLVLGSGWWGWQESEKDFEEAAGKPEMTMMENLTFIEPLNKDYCIELNCKYFELNHKTL